LCNIEDKNPLKDYFTDVSTFKLHFFHYFQNSV